MATQRQKQIAESMSVLSDRKFTAFEVGIIESCKQLEPINRKEKNITIDVKTESGRNEINKRVAAMVNEKIKPQILIEPKHIKLYKRCFTDEYTNRTGKCAWGFKELRSRLGYDPETGKEID